MALAFSYLRFSSIQQFQGDSIARQTRTLAAFLTKNGLTLDESLSLRELGRSAFRGKHRENPDRQALASFLKMVEERRIPTGSYLIVEALDRLTREDIQPALLLILGLLQAGVRVVQLTPSEMVYTDKSNAHEVMLMIVELMRGHSESKRKSDMISSVWSKRREVARKGKAYTAMVPAWIRANKDGKLELIPERAAVVKRLFALATNGYGLTSIVRKFNDEKVPPFGKVEVKEGRKRSQFSGRWNRCYLGIILRDRRAMGEFQPCRRDGDKKVPEGEPIPNYFPAVVSEKQWLAARAGAAERRMKPGRIGKFVNIFAGLLKNARDGDAYFQMTKIDTHQDRVKRSKPIKTLVNLQAAEGHTKQYSFPYDVFEHAILSKLAELDPNEVMGTQDDRADDSLALAGKVAELDARIAELESELRHGDVKALARVLRQLESERDELKDQLTSLRQDAATPLNQSWRDTKSILTAIRKGQDDPDLRLRLRSALRRIVESIWLMVVPRGRMRLAEAQVNFTGGSRRVFFIVYSAATGGSVGERPARWSVWSIKHPDDGIPFNEEDLRDRDQAECVRGYLEKLPKERVEKLLAKGHTLE